jgi:sarcosine oxidase
MTDSFDVAVIGAGVFGAWTAYQLQRAGATVALIDAYGPGNTRASSGGESRIIRMCYGPDDLYTRSSSRSLEIWKQLFDEQNNKVLERLFYPTKVLLLAREGDSYAEATLATLTSNKIQFEQLDRDELSTRYPQLEPGENTWGILEPESGVLMARLAVKRVVAEAQRIGVKYFEDRVEAPESVDRLGSIKATSGRTINAANFVFACGPWLPKMFPELLGDLIHVTRQEVFFFGVPADDHRFDYHSLPTWIDFGDLVYSMPNLDGRGLKIAIDAHGPDFDPDTGERAPTAAGMQAVREYLATRLPALKDAPILESRVCQYENTSNGDFLIDRHPDFQNVWLVGGGSGHGFKHGPVVGEYVAGLISQTAEVEPRFGLQSRSTIRERKVF